MPPRDSEVYEAIGRYVVGFSWLMSCMEMRIGDVADMYSAAHIGSSLTDVLLGQTGAYELTNAFFEVLTNRVFVRELDAEEKRIAGVLRTAVITEISHRNRVAHGHWFVGWFDDVNGDPKLVVTKPGRRQGATEYTRYDIDEMRRWSDDLRDLIGLVNEFAVRIAGTGGASGTITDYLVVRDGRVVREGPLASSTDAPPGSWQPSRSSDRSTS